MVKALRMVVPVVFLFFFLLSPSCSSQKTPPKKEEKKVEKKAEKKEEKKENPEAVNWHKFDEGLKLAKERGKKIMTFFYTNWCGYCKKMLRYTFTDKKIIKILNEDFISIKVDGESRNKVLVDNKQITEKQLTAGYVASGFPTTWFFEPDGEKLSPMVGYRGAEDFADVLTYVAGDWYRRISFQDYLKKKDELEGNKK